MPCRFLLRTARVCACPGSPLAVSAVRAPLLGFTEHAGWHTSVPVRVSCCVLKGTFLF